MTSGADLALERASRRLHKLAAAAAERGGLVAKLAQPLEDDSLFVRKLKPSLIAKRIRGELPTDEQPEPAPAAPLQPAAKPPSPPAKTRTEGPSPWALATGAATAGIILAKLIDWRGHAHPRFE